MHASSCNAPSAILQLLSCFRVPAFQFCFAHVSMDYVLIETWGQHPIVLWSLFMTVTSCSSYICLLSLVSLISRVSSQNLSCESHQLFQLRLPTVAKCHISQDSPHRISRATVTSCSSCVCLLSLSITSFEILLIESPSQQSPAVLAASAYCCSRYVLGSLDECLQRQSPVVLTVSVYYRSVRFRISVSEIPPRLQSPVVLTVSIYFCQLTSVIWTVMFLLQHVNLNS